MKIYSEEQVKNAIKLARFFEDNIMPDDTIVKKLHPIVLPTDEEVENYYGKVHDFGDWEGFKRGTKWMRDKIQGGNE